MINKNSVSNDILDSLLEENLIVRHQPDGKVRVYPNNRCPNYVTLVFSEFDKGVGVSVGYWRDSELLSQSWEVRLAGYEETMNGLVGQIKYVVENCIQVAMVNAEKREYSKKVLPIPKKLEKIVTRHLLDNQKFRVRFQADVELEMAKDILDFLSSILVK